MTDFTSWFVGMKVVCVETWCREPYRGHGDEQGPVAGQVYTIRQIGLLDPTEPSTICLRTVEIVNPVHNYDEVARFEICFAAERFRPVQTRSTDISVFTALLNTNKEREKA